MFSGSSLLLYLYTLQVQCFKSPNSEMNAVDGFPLRCPVVVVAAFALAIGVVIGRINLILGLLVHTACLFAGKHRPRGQSPPALTISAGTFAQQRDVVERFLDDVLAELA